MEKNNSYQLVLFTINYPYGKGEAFIESEIPILASKFESVYIFPSLKVKGKRVLPENVHLIDCLTERNKEVSFRNIVALFNKLIFPFLFTLIKSPYRLNYVKFWKSFVGFAIDDLSKQDFLAKFISEERLSDAIFYDYWFVNSTLSISNLKRKGVIKKTVARCHRFDLYDEELYEGVVSFREYKIKYLDKILPISLHGKQYVISRLPKKYHQKVEQFYLGIKPPKGGDKKVNGKAVYKVVSCSRIVAHKNVADIVEALSHLDINIKWVHFGSGPLMERVEVISQKLPSNIKYELKGEVSNSQVIDYYANNKVDLFLSLSQSEGLPVSIMEAMMYGIPIVAKSVCGIPEIVIDGCGQLIEPESSNFQVAKVIKNTLLSDFDENFIKKVTIEKFNASDNYSRFSDYLISIINN